MDTRKVGRVRVSLFALPDLEHSVSPLSTIFLAFAMATDAFAAAIGKGVSLRRPTWRDALWIGLVFGVVEAITPVVGWLLGFAAAQYITAWDHWIAFVLLGVLGLRMIWAGWRGGDDDGDDDIGGLRSGKAFWLLVLTAVATSIDAMVVGVTLAFLEVNIIITAIAIGLATTLMATLGILLGRLLGTVTGRWAEAIGGVILIVMGTLILIDHLGSTGVPVLP